MAENVFWTIVLAALCLVINKAIRYEHDYPSIFIVISAFIGIIGSLVFKSQYQDSPFFISVILVNIALIDLKYLEIPDTYNAMLLLLGIVNVLVLKDYSLFITGIISFALFFIISVISGGALGGGDIKLALGLGLFFRFPAYVNFLTYTFGVGALIATVLLLLKKKSKKDKMAFGPFMSLGAILAMLL